MKKIRAGERQTQILELLSRNGSMKVTELADYFQVSRETIRRDLTVLHQKGSIRKWFGGALPNSEKNEYDIQAISERPSPHSAEKMQICRKALSLLPPQATIFLDNGSTILYLARYLSQMSGYTIITPSIACVSICASSSNKIIVCPGAVDPLTVSATGSYAADFLNLLRTDFAFLCCSGFRSNDGPTSSDLDYSQVKAAAPKNTQTSIVLSDSSKAGYSSLLPFAKWEEIDYLITDSGLDQEIYQSISSRTQVIFADR